MQVMMLQMITVISGIYDDFIRMLTVNNERPFVLGVQRSMSNYTRVIPYTIPQNFMSCMLTRHHYFDIGDVGHLNSEKLLITKFT